MPVSANWFAMKNFKNLLKAANVISLAIAMTVATKKIAKLTVQFILKLMS